MDDGLFLGLQHQIHNAAIDRTHFTIQVDWYRSSGLVVGDAIRRGAAARSRRRSTCRRTRRTACTTARSCSSATASRWSCRCRSRSPRKPAQDAAGNLTGTRCSSAGRRSRTPSATCATTTARCSARPTGGGAPSPATGGSSSTTSAKKPPEGTQFLADTTWDDAAPFTDLDTLIFGRSENAYQLFDGSDPFGGPYILDTVGKSENTNTGAGVWLFDTASGGAHEVVVRPGAGGPALARPAPGRLDRRQVRRAVHDQARLGDGHAVRGGRDDDRRQRQLRRHVQVQRRPRRARRPRVRPEPAGDDAGAGRPGQPGRPVDGEQQEEPDAVSHASRLTVDTSFPTEDIDLFVVYDANNDGVVRAVGDRGVVGRRTANESVELVRPPDGNYQIWLHGFQVAGTPSITMRVNAVQGNDLTVSGLPTGAVPAGTPVTLHVAFAKPMTAGQDYFGELLLGPATAPSAFTVPVTVAAGARDPVHAPRARPPRGGGRARGAPCG